MDDEKEVVTPEEGVTEETPVEEEAPEGMMPEGEKEAE